MQLSVEHFGGMCLLCADYDYYMAIMRLSFVNFVISEIALSKC